MKIGIDEASIIALRILESIKQNYTPQEEGMFIAGFTECIKYLNLNNDNKYQNIQTKENYDKLLYSGMFWEMHPELSGNYDIDKQVIES